MVYDPKMDPFSPLTPAERSGPRPTPPIELELIEVEAPARLMMDRLCEYCDAKINDVPSQRANGLPKTVGWDHEPMCPTLTR